MELESATLKKLATENNVENIKNSAIQDLGQLLELYAGYITEEAVGIAEERQKSAITRKEVEKALK